LLALSLLPQGISATEPELQSAADPELLPVPADVTELSDAACVSLPLSPKAEKLILVSAQIDAQAEAPQVVEMEEGSSSRRMRKAAIDDLPRHLLSAQQRAVVDDVLDSMSVFRRLPAFACELDPRVHDYFTEHPDVAVSIWRAMAISQLQMTQRNRIQYDIDTRDGTTGMVTVLHQSRESCLVYCEGMFKSPYLKHAIHAKSLMHLRTHFATDDEGHVYATHQADLFVAFPSEKVGTIAKLISPVSNAIMDRNFQEISLFIHVMWRAMSYQPGWVEQIAGRLEGVHPVRKDELLKLTADVYVTTQTNLRRRSGLPVALEVIRPPGEPPEQTAATPPSDAVR
jgi:hypothetical protein